MFDKNKIDRKSKLKNRLFVTHKEACMSFLNQLNIGLTDFDAIVLFSQVVTYVVDNEVVVRKISIAREFQIIKKYLKILLPNYKTKTLAELLETNVDKDKLQQKVSDTLSENYYALFEDKVHKSVDLQNKINNIDFSYYIRALKEMPKHSKSSNSATHYKITRYSTLIKCHDLIILNKILGISYKKIIDYIGFVHGLENPNTLGAQISKCMQLLIDTARNLFENEKKQKND